MANNLQTEEQAKATWCPMARVIGASMQGGTMTPVPGVYAHNRVQEGNPDEASWHPSHCCLASKCQWWTWYISPDQVALDPKQFPEAKGRCSMVLRWGQGF